MIDWRIVLPVLLIILFLFTFFLRSVMIPLIRLELSNDFNGAQELLASRGWKGFFAVILIEALQMVVIFIPAEFIQISCGLSYSFPVALLLCDLGVCLGASIIFILVRVLHVHSRAYEKRMQRIERISASVHERNTVTFLYLLFFMPIIPFGAICYYGSGSGISYKKYLLTVATGVIPSIVVSNLMGDAGRTFLIYDLPVWLLILVIVVLAVLLFLLIAFFIRYFCFRGNDGTPDSMMYALIFFIVRTWLGKRQNLTLDEERLKEAESPYILLSNHESFYDFYYLSQLAHPRNPSFLVNEYYCTRPVLKHMARKGGILSKKLFTRDMSTAVGLLRMVRAGFPVVIFPEGRLSTDGRSNPIVEPGGALYKRLKVDLVLVKIDGAYYADPKWRKKSYRSDIRVSVCKVMKKEKLQAMSPEQIDAEIAAALWNDAGLDEKRMYRQKDKASGLETVLYRCADCGALYSTRGSGNDLKCMTCGASHSLNERYRFTSGPETIGAYYDCICEMEKRELSHFIFSAPVDTKIFGANGGPVRREEGECTLTEEGFRYASASVSFFVPIDRLPALAYSCGKEFELYHQNELYYFYPKKNRNQVVRWALFVDLLHERDNTRQTEPER